MRTIFKRLQSRHLGVCQVDLEKECFQLFFEGCDRQNKLFSLVLMGFVFTFSWMSKPTHIPLCLQPAQSEHTCNPLNVDTQKHESATSRLNLARIVRKFCFEFICDSWCFFKIIN